MKLNDLPVLMHQHVDMLLGASNYIEGIEQSNIHSNLGKGLMTAQLASIQEPIKVMVTWQMQNEIELAEAEFWQDVHPLIYQRFLDELTLRKARIGVFNIDDVCKAILVKQDFTLGEFTVRMIEESKPYFGSWEISHPSLKQNITTGLIKVDFYSAAFAIHQELTGSFANVSHEKIKEGQMPNLCKLAEQTSQYHIQKSINILY